MVKLNYLLAYFLSGRGFDGLVKTIRKEYFVSTKTAQKEAHKMIANLRSGRLQKLKGEVPCELITVIRKGKKE
jgi:hypothetical protein